MADAFIGEVRAFGFSFAPRGWAQCAGQQLAISQNQALFALLGTAFGGNGVQTFALPDLRGRIGLGVSTQSTMGEVQGTESVTLTSQQIPLHVHSVNVANNGTVNATNIPGPTVILGSGSSTQTNLPPVNIYANVTPDVQLAPLGVAGSAAPHENRMPSLVMNYCIALVGIFPSRN